jgi:hypothetical protein
MSCYTALVKTGVLEEQSVCIIGVTRIGELGIMVAVTCNQHSTHQLLLVLAFLAHRFLHPDDAGAMFLWNVGSYKSYVA